LILVNETPTGAYYDSGIVISE